MTAWTVPALAGTSAVAAAAGTILSPPTLPFAVRVPRDRIADPVVLACRRWFVRMVVLVGLVVTALWVAALAAGVRGDLAWPAVAVLAVADGLLFSRCHRGLRAAKAAGDWQAGRRAGVTVDTGLRTEPVRPPWVFAVPAVLVLAAGAALGAWRYRHLPAALPRFTGYGVDPARHAPTTPWAAFQPVLFQLAVTVLVPTLLLMLVRLRPELDAARPAGSARRYRAFLTALGRLLLLMAGGVNLGLLAGALQLWGLVVPSAGWTVLAGVPVAGAVFASVLFGARVGQAGDRLPDGPGERDENSGLVRRDDDRHWRLAGLVYANRRDRAVLVPRRIGVGWTLNLGHPVAWIVTAAVVTLALLAALGVLPTRPRG